MKIEKIDVQTSNKKYALDISILVDNQEFLMEIDRLRAKWNITKLYDINSIDIFLSSIEVQTNQSDFACDIDSLLKKFNRGRNFKLVVEYALATGVVPEGVYKGCYFDVVTIGEKGNLNNPERYQYVIVLSPRTELREVELAYKEFKQHIKQKINFENRNLDIEIPTDKDLIEQYYIGNIHKSADIDKFKSLRDLDRTRTWYWMRYGDYLNGISKKPRTYDDIITEWNDMCPEFGTDDKKHLKECIYCCDVSNIGHSLDLYKALME